MKTAIPILVISLLFLSCKQTVYQGSCDENPTYKNKLLVFVGEKLNISQIPDLQSIHYKYKATYKIIQPVCGSYSRDTIDFLFYGNKATLENYKTVMLFLIKDNHSVYYEHGFFDVYKTKSGQWASTYNSREYRSRDSNNNNIKPEKIDFVEEVSFNTKWLSRRDISYWYPHPYYNLVSGKAIAVYGNYLPELLALSKSGALNYMFEDPKPMAPIQDVRLADLTNLKIKFADSIKLINAYEKLYNAILERNFRKIQELSLEEVYCSICDGLNVIDYGNQLDKISTFIDSSFDNLPQSKLWELMSKRDKFRIKITVDGDHQPENFKLNSGEKLTIYSISFDVLNSFDTYDITQEYDFEFVKKEDVFTFYGVETFNKKFWYKKSE